MASLNKTPKLYCEKKMEVDRISNLPENVIDQILSHLSIRDAVRTSLLSRKWRYKWAMLPCIVFNKPCKLNKIVSIVDQVLVLHIGPIHKFVIVHSMVVPLNHSAIDRWILHLSRTSIKDFVLGIWSEQLYKVPSSLFSCQSLTNLELWCCLLIPPSTFKGFMNLKSLKLHCVSLAQDVFENLISCCPLLERLNLCRLTGLSHLKINAPNLQVFDVNGSLFVRISFENTSSLAEVTISGDVTISYNQNGAYRNSCNLLKFFAQSPHIRRLDICCKVLKDLTVGIEPRKLPKLYVDLNYLAIGVNLHDKKDCLTALCLLSSAPNLQELKISVRSLVSLVSELSAAETENNFWEDDCWNCLFTKLKLVKIIYIGDTQRELDFVKFILSKSPALERMVVAPYADSSKEELVLVKKFLCFRRASVRAEIILV